MIEETLNLMFMDYNFLKLYDIKLLEEESCKVVIQVDGKKRGIFNMPINSDEKIIIKKSKEVENVLKYIKNEEIIPMKFPPPTSAKHQKEKKRCTEGLKKLEL